MFHAVPRNLLCWHWNRRSSCGNVCSNWDVGRALCCDGYLPSSIGAVARCVGEKAKSARLIPTMFSYYGGKGQKVQWYPAPRFERVIEPFCGSARYACSYYARDVWINELYVPVYRIWKWIQQASWADVQALPDLTVGEDLRDYKQLGEDERMLLGFCVGRGRSTPGNVLTDRANQCRGAIKSLKMGLRCLVGRINHWKITNHSYARLPNLAGTWFIDPPYQFGAEHYPCSTIDYPALLRWTKQRRGEAIVCENSKNTWLPRSAVQLKSNGLRSKSTEVMYYHSQRPHC